MNAFLTAAALVMFIAVAPFVLRRVKARHTDDSPVHRDGALRSGRRVRDTPHASVGPGRFRSSAAGDRRDHRDGGRGRFPPRRRRSPHDHDGGPGGA